jgi:hypothetical protein
MLQGGTVDDYGGLYQINNLDVGRSVVKIATGKDPEPIKVTIQELTDDLDKYQSMVIQLDSIQFKDYELGQTYADSVNKEDVNRDLEDCTGATIIVRTSGYANFANHTVAEGNGSFIAISGRYNQDAQLTIRTIEEVQLTVPRCDASVEVPEVNTTIPELKALYQGARLQIADDLVIGGYVVANDESGNYYKTLVIQDDDGGIELKINDFDLFMNYPEGQEIYVKCQNLYLDTYGEVIQLGSVYDDNGVEKFGGIQPGDLYLHVIKGQSVVPVTPEIVTITDIDDAYIGMLIQLNEVQFTESELGLTWADPVNLYSENRTLEDCSSNTIVVRTSGYCDFAGEELPEGNGIFVAVVSAYNGTMQLYVRNLGDIDLSGERCDVSVPIDPVPEVNEPFDNAENYTDYSQDGWLNVIVSGNRKWQGKEFSGNKYVQATGYNSGLDELETWLITPPVINTNGDKKLTFISAMAYWEHTANVPFTVYASTDYDGTNFETANWTEISANLPTQGNANYEWVESGEISLAGFVGNVAIAFKYYGSDTESTSIQIDDVVINDGGGGGIDPVEEVVEYFNSVENYTDIDLPGWTNLIVAGDRKWQGKEYGGNKYAQATGYNSGLADMETWLITPPVINTNGDKVLTFKCAQAYWEHTVNDPITVLASTDYDGTNFGTATWTALNPNLPGSGNVNYEFIESGNILLSGFVGNVAIAFKYKGSDTESTSIQVDDVLITD